MNNILLRILRKLFKYSVLPIANFLKVDLLLIAYQAQGILNFGSEEYTGEKYVLEEVLDKKIKSTQPVIFDVGANVGNYTKLLVGLFPSARIYSFEPNVKAYKVLADNFAKNSNVICENIGMGKDSGHAKIYSYSTLAHTELGTASKEALIGMGKVDDEIEEVDFQMTTIDTYCKEHRIEKIDFLKIDTEGREIDVIFGALGLIKSNSVKFIQFEFNSCNVYYRVFLKDFYDILTGYDFFRIKKGKLIPLGKYDSINEVFKYQNILAVRNAK